jgi:hypothetical protein
MRITNQNCLAVVIALQILVLVSCKKNPANVDPTPGPFKASFIIYEPFYETSAAVSTDTIVTYQAAFMAGGNYSSYAWKVGEDTTIHRTKSFLLRFPLEVSGTTIPVQLIATKDGQADTVKKSFTVMAARGTPNENVTPYSVALPYVGQFKGSYAEDTSHQFIVTITNLDTSTAYGTFRGFRVLNLPEGCGGKYTSGQPCMVNQISPANYSYPFQFSYKSFFVNDGDDIGCCPPVSMLGYMDSTNHNKIIIDCTIAYSKTNVVKRKFIGAKL